MKQKNKFFLYTLKMLFDNVSFKVALILALVTALYGAYLNSYYTYITNFISLITNPKYYIFGVFIFCLVTSLNVYNIFDNYDGLIIRLQSKEKYLKKLIKHLILTNSITYIIILITIVISLNIFGSNNGLGLEFNNNLNTNSFIYLIFVILRLYIIMQFITVGSILLCKIFDAKIIIFLNMLLYSCILIIPVTFYDSIDSVMNIHFSIVYYLSVIMYDSFELELLCTLTYFILLYIFLIMIYKLTKNKMKKIGD